VASTVVHPRCSTNAVQRRSWYQSRNVKSFLPVILAAAAVASSAWTPRRCTARGCPAVPTPRCCRRRPPRADRVHLDRGFRQHSRVSAGLARGRGGVQVGRPVRAGRDLGCRGLVLRQTSRISPVRSRWRIGVCCGSAGTASEPSVPVRRRASTQPASWSAVVRRLGRRLRSHGQRYELGKSVARLSLTWAGTHPPRSAALPSPPTPTGSTRCPPLLRARGGHDGRSLLGRPPRSGRGGGAPYAARAGASRFLWPLAVCGRGPPPHAPGRADPLRRSGRLRPTPGSPGRATAADATGPGWVWCGRCAVGGSGVALRVPDRRRGSADPSSFPSSPEGGPGPGGARAFETRAGAPGLDGGRRFRGSAGCGSDPRLAKSPPSVRRRPCTSGEPV
jgi:hypothetical protein